MAFEMNESLKQLLDNRQLKATLIAVLAVSLIVIFQVKNLQQQTPMCELLDGCRLRDIDLHRMQIALSKAGLSEFKIRDQQVLVPQTKHAEYLQAITEHNAIPDELKLSTDDEQPMVNPFLSRTQQLAIDRENKKRQIQRMIVRLPYVDQAWLEMDRPETRSPFSKTNQSAVISIRPDLQSVLEIQHIDTVRQMVAGAISGLQAEQIVVIDLSTGFAHRLGHESSPLNEQIRAQQAAYTRQQVLEKRVQQALEPYPGLKIRVFVETVEQANQLAAETPSNWKAAVPDHYRNSQPNQSLELAGANAPVSIAVDTGTAAQSAVDRSAGVLQVNFVEPNLPGQFEKVTVLIDVPYDSLQAMYGQANDSVSRQIETVEEQFLDLKTKLEQIVQSLVARDAIEQNGASVVVSLIRPPVAENSERAGQLTAFLQTNWPSLSILVIALILIGLVTRPHPQPVAYSPVVESDQLRSNHDDEMGVDGNDSNQRKQEMEARLSQLIEQNPEATSQVIQSWIKDAA